MGNIYNNVASEYEMPREPKFYEIETINRLPKTECNIPKRENDINEELQSYIYDLCNEKNIPIDLRFAVFADENLFYEEGKGYLPISCEHYHVDNISDVKKLIFNTYIVRLMQRATLYQTIAIYISDVVNTGNGYSVVVGGKLIKNSK